MNSGHRPGGYLRVRETAAAAIGAAVSEYQERGPLQSGDRVTVTGFEGVENLCDVLANIKAGHSLYVFSLCDLKAVGKNQPITP